MVSERACIKLIQQYADIQDSDFPDFLVKGIGDDCAVIKKDTAYHLMLTTDTLVEGVHFNLSWHPPYLLGRKSAAVNLSDIAAMGGQPKACLLSLAFPEVIPSWFEDFMKGFSRILKEHNTLLVGGDTVKGHNIVIGVTLVGEAKPQNICYRSGAQPGDTIWVSGPLGNAAAGLDLCRNGLWDPEDSAGKWQEPVMAHLDPEPQVVLGQALAGSGLVRAMMDISDGLATDLAHLCTESDVGAEIRQDHLPVSEILQQAALELQVEVIDWILRGGEDYQLLFTAKPSDELQLRQLVAGLTGREIFPVGRIIEGQGVFLCNSDKRQDISYQGYDHFSR